MKFRNEKDSLVLAATGAARLGEMGLAISVAGNEVRVEAESSEMSCVERLEISGGDDGSTFVPSRLLTSVLKSCSSGAIEVELDEAALVVSDSQGSEFQVPLISGGRTPNITEPGAGIEVEFAHFKEALSRVVPAVSKDKVVPDSALLGVYFEPTDEGLLVVATDKYRCAMATVPGVALGTGKALVPGGPLAEVLKRDGDVVSVAVDDGRAHFTVGGSTIASSLMDESAYPVDGIRRLFDEDRPLKLTFDGSAMKQALRKVGAINGVTRVRIELDEPDTASISARDKSTGATALTEIEASTGAIEGFREFNPTFLGESIDACGGGEIVMHLTDSMKKPATLTGDGVAQVILMPIRPDK